MELKTLRTQIDTVDAKIMELFKERMALSGEVANYKKENDMPVENHAREREILARVSKEAGDDFAGAARLMYSVLFDASRSHQSRLIGNESHNALKERVEKATLPLSALFPDTALVACQGAEGAYSQQACEKLFAAPDVVYFRTFEGVFQAVESGLCEYGVLPIENSSAGSVSNVYSLMNSKRFHIVRSTRVRIVHNLMAKPGTKMSDIKKVYSHEQALSQCSLFFEHHSNLTSERCENTALAAQLVAKSDDNSVACLCSPECASLYGLTVLDDNVQNNVNNYTRFIVIKKDFTVYPGANRISLLASVDHRPGMLYRLVARCAVLGINLVKLENKPIPGSDGEMLFYLDLDANIHDDKVQYLLSDMAESDKRFVLLGCYGEV